MNTLAELFFTFAKIGCFTFGGGYAMIPLIEDSCVERKNWITHEDMMNITVIAESTPGPVAINCATFVGYKKAGLTGSLIATLGMVLPSFVIIYVISMFLENFLEIVWVAKAFQGIRIAVGILIANAGINMIRRMRKKKGGTVLSYLILAAAFVLMLLINVFSWRISSILLMLVSAAVSLGAFLLRKAASGKDGEAV